MHADIQGGEVAGGAVVAPALFVSQGARCWSDAPDRRLVHLSAGQSLPLFFVLGAALAEDRVPPVFEGFHPASLSLRGVTLRG